MATRFEPRSRIPVPGKEVKQARNSLDEAEVDIEMTAKEDLF